MRAKTFAASASLWRACVAVLLISGLVSSAALANKSITKIDVINKADRAIISVQGNSALSMSPFSSVSGRYLGFQLPFDLTAKGRLVGIRSGKIFNVRYSNFRNNPSATRIVVNTAAHMDYSTKWSADKKHLDISIWKHGVTSKPIRVASVQTNTPVTKVLGMVEETAPLDTIERNYCAPKIRVEVKPVAANTKYVMMASAKKPFSGYFSNAKVEKKISLNFLGADINDVLKALSIQSGKNIVASKEVTGNITVSLNNVSVEDALDYIAKLSGYGYSNNDGTYLVASKASLRVLNGDTESPDNMVDVVSTRYAGCDELIALLGARYPEVRTAKSNPKGSGQANTSPNKLLVLSGSQKDVNGAKDLIAAVEASMKSQISENSTEIYRVKYVKSAELAETITSLIPSVSVAFGPSDSFEPLVSAKDQMSVSTGDIKPKDDKEKKDDGGAASSSGQGDSAKSEAPVQKTLTKEMNSKTLIFVGSQSDVEAALKLAASIDIKSPQIKIEAKITSLTESGEKKLGLSWNWGDFTKLETYTGDPTTGPVNASGHWSRQPWNFAATLEALVTNGDGKLLASPSLLCVEGRPASFFVGDEVRYIVLVQQTAQGNNITTDKANVGIELRVLGDVSSDGYITLNLHPEVSVLQLTENKTAGITLPTITRRYTDHIVRVKSGETIIIGGLISDNDLDTMSKVPILGDIPFFGNLFRHRDKTKQHNEVVIFITASVVND